MRDRERVFQLDLDPRMCNRGSTVTILTSTRTNCLLDQFCSFSFRSHSTPLQLMSMQWQVIASVDETKRSRDLVSGGRESTPSARPIVYISREQSILHKLRNSVVALSLVGSVTENVPLYASVKVYSQQSIHFSKDNRFPEKLDTRQVESGSGKLCDVVVSNLLWWELQHQQRQQQRHTSGVPREFHEDFAMPTGSAPIIVHARLVS